MRLAINHQALVVVALMLKAFGSWAQDAGRPVFAEGDKWLYKLTEEVNESGVMSSTTRHWESGISRVGSKFVTISVKPQDSNLPPKEYIRDVDWSLTKNIKGANTVIAHRYDFPMWPGKTWTVEYETESTDIKIKAEHFVKRYTVIGWEDIKVAAGDFHALKIEMEGEWVRTFNEVGPSSASATTQTQAGTTSISRSSRPVTAAPTGGRLYEAVWYSPAIKGHVKLIDENYRSGGSLNKRATEELEAFYPKAPH